MLTHCHRCKAPLANTAFMQIPFAHMTLGKYPDLVFCQTCFIEHGLEKGLEEDFEEYYLRVVK